MSKIFFVTGEASGDQTAAWFVQHKISSVIPGHTYLEAVGGDELSTQNVPLYATYTTLNVVGLFEIIKHLPRLLRFAKILTTYLIEKKFTHVVLVDFPGFNLRLGKLIKQRCPNIKIIYLAPPQLWCWAEWRLKKLTAIADTIIVLFPFEVAWYHARGVTALYLGNPVAERLLPLRTPDTTRPFRLGIFPGSRTQELTMFIPLLREVIIELKQNFPSLEIAIFQAPGIDISLLEALTNIANALIIPPEDRIAGMQTCAVALTKAGTVTLELGIMRVPTIIFYKAHWLTFALAKTLVNIDRMGLPNLITGKDLMPEFIQSTCTPKNLCAGIGTILRLWQQDKKAYATLQAQLGTELEKVFFPGMLSPFLT